ncbi:M13 family metallopeptidase [Corynebacterium kozikiae]|uniref:M13 family metallopeptidase n=1 Tax=Corynebacterium kozikiae TaxID=2968469 RepID=UPI00211D1418|nr:M13-type metalloendopeptidase [Corynebacterium sp. 76QC2CO]MCQ9343525.1 peptidase M13 [Corynebacterium sp. 76QC2CO]
MTRIENLNQFINGPWLSTHEIPADRGVDGAFHKLRDDAQQAVREILEQERGTRAGKLYASFMDTEGIEQQGIAAIDADLALLDVDSVEAYVAALGALDRVGVPGLLGFWVEKDSAGEDALLYLYQGGLGLPDEAYYREPAHEETLRAYQEHVATMLAYLPEAQLLSLSPAEAAEAIVELEKAIAAGHWDVVASRDAVATYNPTEFAELPEYVRNLLQAAGAPEHKVVVMMPSFFTHLGELLDQKELRDFRLLSTWRVLHSRAGLLPHEISLADFAFYGTKLTGATEQKDRWKRGVELAERLVGEEIGQEYVARHFPASSKAEMEELVGYLTRAYEERISNLEWMTPATRERALEKLSKFRAKIGYPDTWRDYGELTFDTSGADLVENVRRGATAAHDRELAKVGKPVDRNEWVCTPQTVNAFYHPVVNDITFPAAILRSPFYSPENDAAQNFGAIGAVIGHEIGHGFDDQGSQYDGEGNLKSWWTDEDRAAFSELTDKLVAQFEGLVPQVLREQENAPGVNGKFTLGENIGDLGGLGIAVVAYRNYLADQGLSLDASPMGSFPAEGSDPAVAQQEWSGLQRLFFAWALVWRTAIRPELAAQYLAMDPHSPAEFRCNVIAANIAEFYQAFEVPEDSEMFIEPSERITIW